MLFLTLIGKHLIKGALVQHRVRAGDQEAVEIGGLAEFDQHSVHLRPDADRGNRSVFSEFGEHRINRLVDMADSSYQLNDAVNKRNVDPIDPQPLQALHKRLAGRRRAIYVASACLTGSTSSTGSLVDG